MHETSGINTDPRLVALLDRLKGFVCEAVLETVTPGDSSEPHENDDLALDYAAQGAYLAWIMVLDKVWNESGGLTAEDLNEALLPPGTSDEELTGLAGGIVGGAIIRAALKRFKATLPSGTVLPEVIIELLKDE